jgi:hypothetical protein
MWVFAGDVSTVVGVQIPTGPLCTYFLKRTENRQLFDKKGLITRFLF